MNLKGLNKLDVDHLTFWEAQVCVAHRLNGAEAFLFRHSVMRIFANETRDQGRRLPGDGWYDPTPSNAQAAHIVDWLRADLLTSAPWLENVDEMGRPRKLLKCKSIDDLMREADKAMDRRNGGRRAKALGPDDEVFVADLGNGFTLVRMLTPEALDVESERMSHCIGHGGYDGLLLSGWGRYLSVRNRKGRPIASIELRREDNGFWSIRQIEGKRNTRPPREVMDVVRAYAEAQGWCGRDYYWPTVELEDGSECDIDKIPVGATVQHLEIDAGTLEIYPDFQLPAGLTVLGTAFLDSRVRIPADMTVHRAIEFTRWLDGDPPIVLPESLICNDIRVGRPSDLARPIPTHLVPRIKVRVRKLTGHSFASMEWVEEDQGLDDEPEAPRP